MAQRPLTSDEIINTIKSQYLVPLTRVAGRAVYTSDGIAGTLAAGGAATAADENRMRNDWNANQFVSLARFNGTTADIPANAGTGPGIAAALPIPAGPPPGQIPPLTGAKWDNYTHNDYQRVRYALGAGARVAAVPIPTRAQIAAAAAAAPNDVAAVPIPANLQKEAVRVTVIEADLRVQPIGPTGLNENYALVNVMNSIFNGDWTINPKTNKAIFNVPKSDELLRRCVAVLYAKQSGVDVTVAAGATAGVMANAMEAIISGPFFNNMPKSDSDMYIALLGLNKEDRESLARYDERVDLIREALSQGPVPSSSGIQPGNIVPNPVLNTVSVFSAYPASLQEALRQRRKSDPSSNPVSTLNRIRISMNGGSAFHASYASSASRALPLYPRLVMNDGAHPFAVMEGGAWPMGGPAPNAPTPWPTSRTAPNPVAALDSRIKQLESEFHRVTGTNLGPLSGQIRGYADNLNIAMTNLQKDLETLSNANSTLSQHPPGLGVDVSNYTIQQLKDITDQADKINKDAARTSKQLDKLTQIKDSLEQLVIQSSPASRT